MGELRHRIDRLRRKLAIPLGVVRLRRLVEEFRHQWVKAAANRQSPLQCDSFIRRLEEGGFLLPTFMALHNYLNRCLGRNEIPERLEVMRSLLPRAITRRLVPIALANAEYTPRQVVPPGTPPRPSRPCNCSLSLRGVGASPLAREHCVIREFHPDSSSL